jgi:hypothetical protein
VSWRHQRDSWIFGPKYIAESLRWNTSAFAAMIRIAWDSRAGKAPVYLSARIDSLAFAKPIFVATGLKTGKF